MSVMIRVDGEELHGRDGQTIAGVLLASGQRSWRTAAGAPRGVFCGIGVCQDCLVTVNGVAGVRACQRTAVDGDVVEKESR
ncbi:(2Fe-2S)-binding protein [Microbacterium terrisoli]|jgi:predicted molibdopterin-dependent oxidoreductase YjgC|uniref:(2Fe-2S)-binding protein n=1 Tax=Microbacterium terrisoli TaxID=3242192 RepID=UPI002805BFED|nr:(2Fe-2S)-binding protein [Microbacterium protaetiae]